MSNQTACIKIAYDFLAPEGISASRRITEEFRRDKLPDILHLDTMLWHGLQSVNHSRLRAELSPAKPKGTARSEHRQGVVRNARALTKCKRQQTGPLFDNAEPPSQASRSVQTAAAALRPYKCPHAVCEAFARRFKDLNAVFRHW